MPAMAATRAGVILIIGVHHDDDVGASGQRFAVASLLVAAVAVVSIMNEGGRTPSCLESAAVWSLLESSTKMRMSTTSGRARTVCSSVLSALKAGMTTAIRFPLIMKRTPRTGWSSTQRRLEHIALVCHEMWRCCRELRSFLTRDLRVLDEAFRQESTTGAVIGARHADSLCKFIQGCCFL
jgi:hypothetical protein